MRRIKSARVDFYSCKAGSPDFEYPLVIEANDLFLLRAVARAVERERSLIPQGIYKAFEAFNTKSKP